MPADNQLRNNFLLAKRTLSLRITLTERLVILVLKALLGIATKQMNLIYIAKFIECSIYYAYQMDQWASRTHQQAVF